MKKNFSPLIFLAATIVSILILNFTLPRYLPKTEVSSDAAVLELLITTPSGHVIDPTVSYSHVGDKMFFQLDGLIDSAEILGLDEYDGKTQDELIELDEFFTILTTIDGEWLLVDYTNEVEQNITRLLPYVRESTILPTGYLPDSYLPYADFESDYDMAKFTETFYNIVNERVIKS